MLLKNVSTFFLHIQLRKTKAVGKERARKKETEKDKQIDIERFTGTKLILFYDKKR